MARPIWTGSVAFGLVNVLVALYAATEDKTIHFNQFQAGTSDRIRYSGSTSAPAARSTSLTSSAATR
jgi:non-homologous end joining protein Ku